MARYRSQLPNLAGPAQKIRGAMAIRGTRLRALTDMSLGLLTDLFRGRHPSVLPVPVATSRRRTGIYR